MDWDDQLRQDDLMRSGGLPYDKQQEVVRGWVEFLKRLHADTFATITFDEKKCGVAKSGQNAVDRAEWVITRESRSLKVPLPSFVAAEQHRNKAYHVHMLLRLGGLDRQMDFQIRRALWRVAFAKYGRNQFLEIADVGGVRGYVSKYVVKSRADWKILFPKHWEASSD